METSRTQSVRTDTSDLPPKAGDKADYPGVLSREALLYLAKQRHALALTAAAAEQQAAGMVCAGSAPAMAASSHLQLFRSLTPAAAAPPAPAVRWQSRTIGAAAIGALQETAQPEPAAACLLAAFAHASPAASVHAESPAAANRLAALPLQWRSGETAPVAVSPQVQLSLLVQQQLLMRQTYHNQQQHLSSWLYRHQLQQMLPMQPRQQHTAALLTFPKQWQIHAAADVTAHCQDSQQTENRSEHYTCASPLVSCTTADTINQQTGGWPSAHLYGNRIVGGSSDRQRVDTTWPSGFQPAAAQQEQPLLQLQQQAGLSAAAPALMPAAAPLRTAAAACYAAGSTTNDVRLSWGQNRMRSVVVRCKRLPRNSCSSSSASDPVVPAVDQLVEGLTAPHPSVYIPCSSRSSGPPSSSSSMQMELVTEDLWQFKQQQLPGRQQQEVCHTDTCHLLQQEATQHQQCPAAPPGCTHQQLQAEHAHAGVSGGPANFRLQEQNCAMAVAAVASASDAGAAVSDDWTAAASASRKLVTPSYGGHPLALQPMGHNLCLGHVHQPQLVQQQQLPPLDAAACVDIAAHRGGLQYRKDRSAAAAAADCPCSGQQQRLQEEELEGAVVTGTAAESDGLCLSSQYPVCVDSTGQRMIAAGDGCKPGLPAKTTVDYTGVVGHWAPQQGHVLPVPAAATAAAEGHFTGSWVKYGKRSPRECKRGDCSILWQQQANILNQKHEHQQSAAAAVADSRLRPSRRQRCTHNANQQPATTPAEPVDSWPKSSSMRGKRNATDRHALSSSSMALLVDAAEQEASLGYAISAAAAGGLGGHGAESSQHNLMSWVQQLQPPGEEFSLPTEWQQHSTSSNCNISASPDTDELISLTVRVAGGGLAAGDGKQAVHGSGALGDVVKATAAVATLPSTPGRSKPVSSLKSYIRPSKVVQPQQQIEHLALQSEAGEEEQLQHADIQQVGELYVHCTKLQQYRSQQAEQQQQAMLECQVQVTQQALQQYPNSDSEVWPQQQQQQHQQQHAVMSRPVDEALHAEPRALQILPLTLDTDVRHPEQQQQQHTGISALMVTSKLPQAVSTATCFPVVQQNQYDAQMLPLLRPSHSPAANPEQQHQRHVCDLQLKPNKPAAVLGGSTGASQQAAAVEDNGSALAATTVSGTASGSAAAQPAADPAARDQLRLSPLMQPAAAAGGADEDLQPAGVPTAATLRAMAAAQDTQQQMAVQRSPAVPAPITTVKAAAAAPVAGIGCMLLNGICPSRNPEAQPAVDYGTRAGAAAAATAVKPSSEPVRSPAAKPTGSLAATSAATAAAPALGVPAMMSQIAVWHPLDPAAAAAHQHIRAQLQETAQQRSWDPAAAQQCNWGYVGSGAVLQQNCWPISAAVNWHAGPAASASVGSLQAQCVSRSTVCKRPAQLPAVAAVNSSKRQRVLDLRNGADAATGGAQQLHKQNATAAAAAAASSWCWRWNAATGGYEPMYDQAKTKLRQQKLQTLCNQKQWQRSASVLGQQQQQPPRAGLRQWHQVKLAEQHGQQERRRLQQLQRRQRQDEGYQQSRGPQTARQRRRQQQQGAHIMQGELAQWTPALEKQQHILQCSRQQSSAPDIWSDTGEGCSAGWPQPSPVGAAAVPVRQAAAWPTSGDAVKDSAVESSSCSLEIDPGQSLPAKDAQPGDYKRREPNSHWDADEYESAAVSGAAMLGISLTPLGQNLGECRDPCLMSDLAAAAMRAAKRAAAGLPAAALTAEVGVLLMAHEKGVSTAAAWESWEQCHDGKVVVLAHVKQGVTVSSALPGGEWLRTRLLAMRVKSQWGDISLTAGVMSAVAEMLQCCPNLQHIALVSGQDVPVAALPLPLPTGVSMFGSFQFGRVYDAAAQRVAAAQLCQQLGMSAGEAREWGDSLTFHHTWMILSRPLLLALLTKKQEILQVGQVLNARFMQPDAAVAADEFMLITAAIKYGYSRVVIRSKLQNYIAAVCRQQKQQEVQMEFEEQDEQRRNKLLAAIPGSGCSSEDEEPYASAEELFMAIQAGAAAAALKQQEAAEIGSISDSGLSSNTSRPTRRRTAALLQQQGSSSSNSSSITTVAAVAAALPPRHPGPSAAACSSGPRAGQSGRQVTRSLAAILKDKVAADEATRELAAESGDLHHGVLLDCCPTLALFHPTRTRHPHTWRNFSQVFECDLNAAGEEDDNRLNLLQALGLVKPNQAMFFRKVDVQNFRSNGKQTADDHLLAVLQLMWQGRPLPDSIASLEAG